MSDTFATNNTIDYICENVSDFWIGLTAIYANLSQNF